ncbi:MAG: FAD:protein FMN transferase [Ignavibacteria bacterium]
MKRNLNSYLVILLFLLGCQQQNTSLIELTGKTMGTAYSIKIAGVDFEQNEKSELQSRIDSILAEVNNQMSTWQKNSEISTFNNLEDTTWFKVSKDFVYVVKTAIEVSEKSKGALDITAGPLINLWGFGSQNRPRKVPSDDEIAEEKKRVGFNKIHVTNDLTKIKKDNENIYISLGAIAKGFGVDKVSKFLEKENLLNHMVEIGGEVRAAGKNHLNHDWQIGVSVPDGSMHIQKIVPVSNYSIATSGDYRNYFEENGVRYSHTIEPTTGRPITHKLASVSVIHEDCIVADAMATAIDVLGPELGYELAVKEGLPVFMVIKANNGFVEKMTPEFKAFLGEIK